MCFTAFVAKAVPFLADCLGSSLVPLMKNPLQAVRALDHGWWRTCCLRGRSNHRVVVVAVAVAVTVAVAVAVILLLGR